ncbi:protein phosphatase 2C domain-containing protein [Streptomyces sp. NPDC007084]|uniref:protein phosphatase 2C domain-containing protein n=1 Tax=Streptomyces sp. NPDC007084 TaxID=3154313 RepID=UPI0034538D05
MPTRQAPVSKAPADTPPKPTSAPEPAGQAITPDPAGPPPVGPPPVEPPPAAPSYSAPQRTSEAPAPDVPAAPEPARPPVTSDPVGPPPVEPPPVGPPAVEPPSAAPPYNPPRQIPESPAPTGPPPVTPAAAGPAPTGAAPTSAAPTTLPTTTGGFRPPRAVDADGGEGGRAGAGRAPVLGVGQRPASVDHVGSGPPTYDAEPTALPPADPDELDDLVADTVLDGARYGTSTLRAVSVRGDSARYRGEPRRDSLLTARFGTGEQALVLVAMATGARAAPGAHRAAAEACQWIARAVGRSHARLADDIRAARRGDLKSGLHRLTDRSLGKLRASAAEQGVEPEEYTASLRCLLLSTDPECRTRVFFGVGAGGLFRLRDGEWQDIEPRVAEATGEPVVGFGSPPHETPEGDRLTMDLGITTPPSPYEPAPRPPRAPFRFRASIARPGDTLLLCTGGLAEPLRGEPELAEYLTTRWSQGEPPGLAPFLADSTVRVKGYADDRTAAAVWEA